MIDFPFFNFLNFTIDLTDGVQTYKYCNNIAYNECYMRNYDQAKLILIEDTDETFLQPKLDLVDTKESAFKFLSEYKRLETESDVNAFNSVLKCNMSTSLNSFLEKFPKEVSIYFPQVMFLKDDLAEEIFFKIDLAVSQQNEGRIKFPLKINIKKNANLGILISNLIELKYARNLASIYKHLIKPFLNRNAKLFEKESERMRRFLHMNVNDVRGKSFVNTKTSELLPGPHGPEVESLLTSESYYVSHFRKNYKLSRTDKSIREFGLDLNYFACYVRPMIEKAKV